MGKALSALNSQEEAFTRIKRFLSRARDRCKELEHASEIRSP